MDSRQYSCKTEKWFHQILYKPMKVSPWPNIFSLFRIFVVPLILWLVSTKPQGWNLACFFLFTIAALTDWLDGYLARKLDSVTETGKLLDPMADKILVSSVLILFVLLDWIELLPVLILINRDIAVNGIRSMAAIQGQIISAGSIGKWKTTLQMIAIPCLFLSPTWPDFLFQSFGYYVLWLSVAFSLISGFQYFYLWKSKKSQTKG